MHDAIFTLFDCIRGTDLRTSWLVTVPSNVSCGRNALAALDEIEVNHRLSTMGFTFLTCLQTRTASDATRGIDIELVAEHYAPPLEAPLWAARSSGEVSGLAASWILQAETLNSGILLRGSRVR